jgi:hypothetical protein
MGSLLIMARFEHNYVKLTKSIYTCQGKIPLPRKSICRKIPPENFRGRVYLGWDATKTDLIAGTFVAN